MAYEEQLAERVREALGGRRGVTEKKMFGGLCFLLRGNMCCGIVGEELMVRVGPEAYDEGLTRDHVREMDFTGKPLRGLVYVEPAGIRGARELGTWIARGLEFAATLPAR